MMLLCQQLDSGMTKLNGCALNSNLLQKTGQIYNSHATYFVNKYITSLCKQRTA